MSQEIQTGNHRSPFSRFDAFRTRVAKWIMPSRPVQESALIEQGARVVGLDDVLLRLTHEATTRELIIIYNHRDGTIVFSSPEMDSLLGYEPGDLNERKITAVLDLKGATYLITKGGTRYRAIMGRDFIQVDGRELFLARFVNLGQDQAWLEAQLFEFLSILAHEFRTPLTVINGYINMLWGCDSSVPVNEADREMARVRTVKSIDYLICR